jgi:hypothetical protein
MLHEHAFTAPERRGEGRCPSRTTGPDPFAHAKSSGMKVVLAIGLPMDFTELPNTF